MKTSHPSSERKLSKIYPAPMARRMSETTTRLTSSTSVLIQPPQSPRGSVTIELIIPPTPPALANTLAIRTVSTTSHDSHVASTCRMVHISPNSSSSSSLSSFPSHRERYIASRLCNTSTVEKLSTSTATESTHQHTSTNTSMNNNTNGYVANRRGSLAAPYPTYVPRNSPLINLTFQSHIQHFSVSDLSFFEYLFQRRFTKEKYLYWQRVRRPTILFYFISAVVSLLIMCNQLSTDYLPLSLLSIFPVVVLSIFSNAGMVMRLLRFFEVWFLFLQIMIVCISLCFIFDFDERCILAFGFLFVNQMSFVFLDASDITSSKKLILTIFGFVFIALYALFVYLGLPNNGKTHIYMVYSTVWSAEEIFINHSLTVMSLLAKHAYTNIRHPGRSVILSSPYVLHMNDSMMNHYDIQEEYRSNTHKNIQVEGEDKMNNNTDNSIV